MAKCLIGSIIAIKSSREKTGVNYGFFYCPSYVFISTYFIKVCKDLLSVLQQQLGYADIRTTVKYFDISEDRKRKAAETLDFGLK